MKIASRRILLLMFAQLIFITDLFISECSFDMNIVRFFFHIKKTKVKKKTKDKSETVKMSSLT